MSNHSLVGFLPFWQQINVGWEKSMLENQMRRSKSCDFRRRHQAGAKSEALGVAAQVAVTPAGFAGIVAKPLRGKAPNPKRQAPRKHQ
jgi:hypothetical protein